AVLFPVVTLPAAGRFSPALPCKDQLKFLALGLNLRQQALAEIACGDAYWIELPDHGETGIEVRLCAVKHGLGQLCQSCVAVLAAMRSSVWTGICICIRIGFCLGSNVGSKLLAKIACEQLFVA